MKKTKYITSVILCLLLSAFVLSGCQVNNVNDAVNSGLSFVNRKADVYRAACELVRSKLNAPSTAVFPQYESSFVTDNGNNEYVVSAYAEAENIVGGTSKLEWKALVTYDSNKLYTVKIVEASEPGLADVQDSPETAQVTPEVTPTVSPTDTANSYGNSHSSYSGSSGNSSSGSYEADSDYEDDDDYSSEDSDYDDDSDYEDDDSDYDDSDSYVIPDSDTRKLKKSDLKGLSAWELRIARNEIYARHGRLFQDQELQDYFDEQDWYSGYIDPEDFVDSKELTKLERRNAKFISEYENR